RKATAEGSRAAPVSGSQSTRGPLSSSTATRLLVVPRSMPMIRPTQSFSDGLVDVPEQRAEVRDLGEPAAQLLEGRAAVVGPEARKELAAERVKTRREAVAQPPHLTAKRIGGARPTQLFELLLGLEHVRRDRRWDACSLVTESRTVELEPVPATR